MDRRFKNRDWFSFWFSHANILEIQKLEGEWITVFQVHLVLRILPYLFKQNVITPNVLLFLFKKWVHFIFSFTYENRISKLFAGDTQ